MTTTATDLQPIETIASTEPDELQQIQLFGGNDRFVLPYRQLGEANQYGWFGVAVGAFALLFMVGWIAGPLTMGAFAVFKRQWWGLLLIGFSMLGLYGLRYAMLLISGGLSIVKNQSRTIVHVDGGRLRVTEEFFRMRWNRRCKLSNISKLDIVNRLDADDADEGFQSSDASAEFLGDHNSVLVAHDDTGTRFPVAVAYPRTLLRDLANQLASELQGAGQGERSGRVQVDEVFKSLKHGPKSKSTTRKSIQVTESEEVRSPIRTRPADTDVVLSQHEAGVRIDVPPVGLQGPFRFSFLFGVFWLVLVNLIVVAVIRDPAPKQSIWVAAFVISIFEAVGAALMAWSWNASKRRTAFVTAGDQLMMVSEAWVSKKRKVWDKSQLCEIRIGNSGVEVNEQPVKELQIVEQNGEKVGCLSARSDEEIAWLAWELSSALELEPVGRGLYAAVELPRDAQGRCLPAIGSSARIERKYDRTRITIPPRGLAHVKGLLATGSIMMFGSGLAVAFVVKGLSGDLSALVPLSFALLFCGLGLGLSLLAFVLANRSYVFTVTPQRLSVRRMGMLSDKAFDCSAADMTTVAIADSGTAVNNRRLKQLRIRCRGGKGFTGMTDHSQQDLSLVVVAINEALSRDASV